MRPISLAFAALLGAAAANPMEWPRGNHEYEYGYNPYPTGGSSTSSVAPSSSSSSSSGYPVTSSSSSSQGYPVSSSSSSQGYPVSSSSSSSQGYPVSSSSSSSQGHPIYSTSSSSYIYPTSSPLSSTGTGYVPSSTKGGEHPHPPYSTGVSSSEYPHPPLSTGVSSKPPHPPLSTGYPTTDIITTYTTETICPVTKTYGTQVITTLTTSTITITSCKGGCHHQPTPPASTPIVPPPSNPSGPVTIPTTITTTTYAWVPCSTEVGHNGPSVIYSTYLTASYYPTTYVSSVIVYPTEKPQPPVVTPPVVTPPAECPAPVTVTKVITETVGQECHYCQTKTYTVTESGTKTVITVTLPPTEIPSSTIYPETTSSDKPKPPMSTGATGTGDHPHSTGTGHIPYPTKGTSSVANSSSRVGPKPTGYGHYGW